MNQLEKQFVKMIEQNRKDFYRLAISFVKTRDDALDMVGEATCQAMASLSRVRKPEYMKTWYCRILINTCKSFLRRNRNIVLGDEVFKQLPSPPEVHEDWMDLHEAVHRLPPKYRDVIVLRYFNQLSIDETASMLRRNPNTVKSLLRRGLLMLQQSMGGVVDG